MAEVTVSLEDGFAQDHVVVRVDGATAYEGTDVTTRTQTGLAAAVRVQTADSCRLEVALPGRGVSGQLDLDAAHTPYVRVSLVNDEVDLVSTDQAPYYA